MIFVVYAISTGKIVSTISCANVETAQMNCPLGQSILPVDSMIDDSAFYVDVGSQTLVPIPTRMSAYDTWNWSTKSWEAPAISVLQDAAWTQIKDIRTQKEYGGFVWSGYTFDSDAESQRRLQGAVSMATIAQSAGQPFDITWTLADNSFAVLTASQVIEVGLALGTFVSTLHETARQLREAIYAATTVEEVNAIQWPV